MNENQPDKIIRGYHLHEQIGVGGFGTVYRATQTVVARDVAIKVILPEKANQPNFIRRFEQEAQLVANLEHPFITPLYDYWRDPNGAYLVMRYFKFGTLKDTLKDGPLGLEAAVRLTDQIASALATAHQNRIVHRDLKPSNILLDEDGNAFLADFGIAKTLDQEGRGLTETGAILGSPDYLAPEQARSEPLSPRSDIYSLGILLYEVITGTHPFPPASPVERLIQHLSHQVPDLPPLVQDVGQVISLIIQKATAKSPFDRHPDVLILADAFRQAVYGAAGGEFDTEGLTPQEISLLKQFQAGRSRHQIAAVLGLDVNDVNLIKQHVFEKLGVTSQAQALVRARQLDLLDHDRAPTGIGFGILDNPFIGLHAFQAGDAHNFFGREAMIQTLLDRLADRDRGRFLAVVGASGSGKSSLVKAGLIPALWRGEIPGSDHWFIVDFTPGSHPLDELEIALSRIALTDVQDLRAVLESGPQGLAQAVDRSLPGLEDQILLVIDQFEEIFTLVESESARTQFLALIWTAAAAPEGRIRIALTLRADFFDRPLQYWQLAELIRFQTVTMIPMSSEELAWAITKPAEQAGVIVEPELVAAMVADVQDQPGGLPLLQYALSELFERRSSDRIRQSDYEAIGRVGGALAARAKQIYDGLNENQRTAVRLLFLRLVAVSSDAQPTRRRAARSELRAVSPNPDEMEQVIDLFADYRLLALDRDPASRDPTVEVAHEALLSAWKRLANWLDTYQADLEFQRQLTQLAVEWESAGRETSYLLRGSRLDQLDGWQRSTELALTNLEKTFITISLQRRGRRQRQEAERQAREALLEDRVLRQVSIGLASQSLQALKGRHPEHAVPLALEALENYPYTAQAQSTLSQAVLGQRIAERIPAGGFVYFSQLSATGNCLLASVAESDAFVWDLEKRCRRFTLEDSLADGICWSPDERHILTVRKDRTGFDLWSAKTGKRLTQSETNSKLGVELSIWTIRNWQPWAPDSQRFVLAHPDGSLRIWDLLNSEATRSAPAHDGPFMAYWSQQGDQIVTVADSDRHLIVWDPESLEKRYELSGGARLTFDQWSADGDFFVISEAGMVQVIEAATGELRYRFDLPEAVIFDAKFSPDGRWLVATEPFRGISWLWSMETGLLQATLTGDQQSYAVSWAPDSRRVAISVLTGMRIWDIFSEMPIERMTLEDYAYSISWSPDGQRLFSSGTGAKDIFVIRSILADRVIPGSALGAGGTQAWLDDDRIIGRYYGAGEIRLFSADTLELLQILDGGSFFGNMALHPDGKRLISVNTDGTMRAWDLQKAHLLAENMDQDWLFGCSLSPDGTLLASYGGRDDEAGWAILCFDAATFEERWRITETRSHVGMPAWSPDGSRLAVSFGFGSRAAIVDPENGEVMSWLITEADNYKYVAGLTWSTDGTRIAINVDSGGLILDAASGEEIVRLKELDGTVWGFQWLADDEYLLTDNSSEGKLRVFNTRSGETVLLYDLGGWPGGQVAADHSRLLAVAHDGSARIYPFWLTPEKLIEYAYRHSPMTELNDEVRAAYGLTVDQD
jgi:serine/threonine protein kinase/WD40 repeat protein